MSVETPNKVASKSYPLPSGAVLHLARVPYGAAKELRNALLRAVAAQPLTGGEMKAAGIEDILKDPSIGAALLQRVLLAGASEELEDALFDALRVASYQPALLGEHVRLKVDAALLDHPDYADQVRRDYYAIAHRVVEVAVLPFFSALVSMFAAYRKTSASGPASKSASRPTAS